MIHNDQQTQTLVLIDHSWVMPLFYQTPQLMLLSNYHGGFDLISLTLWHTCVHLNTKWRNEWFPFTHKEITVKYLVQPVENLDMPRLLLRKLPVIFYSVSDSDCISVECAATSHVHRGHSSDGTKWLPSQSVTSTETHLLCQLTTYVCCEKVNWILMCYLDICLAHLVICKISAHNTPHCRSGCWVRYSRCSSPYWMWYSSCCF